LDEVKKFFETYYAPNNAVLAIVGDFDSAEAKSLVERHFGAIKPAQLPPQPDLAEPRQEQEKRVTKKDALAPRPAIALGYHMPERNTPEYYAMGLIEQMLVEGDDSLLHQELVEKRGLTDNVNGAINQLGNMFNYKGPMLLTIDLRYDPTTKSETVLEGIDTTIEPVRTKPVDSAALDRARVKLRSSLYDTMGQFGGFGLMDLLSSFALFDDDPARVNTLVAQFNKVTPELLQKTAQDYLRPSNRTVIELQPVAKDAAAPARKQ
jgi:predicted Zn-dependent peptidase